MGKKGAMPEEEPIQVEGTVSETLPGAKLWGELESGHRVLAHVSGTMRMHVIRILRGDPVILGMSPYDLGK